MFYLRVLHHQVSDTRPKNDIPTYCRKNPFYEFTKCSVKGGGKKISYSYYFHECLVGVPILLYYV